MTEITDRIARWMIWAGWLIFLGLLTLFFNEEIENLQNPNRDVTALAKVGDNEVRLTRNRAGHYVAGGLINGQKVFFIIDTGASDISIPLVVARRLNLQKGSRVRYTTANGSVTGYQTMLDTVQLGNIELHNIRGGINPGMQGEYILLGMTFLKQLEFTQRGKELILKTYQ